MTTISLTLLKAENREYTGKDGTRKTWSSVNTLIDGEVVELSAKADIVNKVAKLLHDTHEPVEVEADISIRQTSFENKKSIRVELLDFKQ